MLVGSRTLSSRLFIFHNRGHKFRVPNRKLVYFLCERWRAAATPLYPQPNALFSNCDVFCYILNSASCNFVIHESNSCDTNIVFNIENFHLYSDYFLLQTGLWSFLTFFSHLGSAGSAVLHLAPAVRGYVSFARPIFPPILFYAGDNLTPAINKNGIICFSWPRESENRTALVVHDTSPPSTIMFYL